MHDGRKVGIGKVTCNSSDSSILLGTEEALFKAAFD